MNAINDDNVYSIDELTEREIERIEEEKSRGSRTRYLFLSPGKKESGRTTNLRPVFRKANDFGQERPMYQVRLHERLDKLVPGTRRRVFPKIKPGVESAVCLNDHDGETYCYVCEREPDMRTRNNEIKNESESTGLQKAQKLHRAMRGWFSNFKRTLWHFFIAIRRIGPVSDGEEWDKGKMPVKKNADARTKANKYGLVRCGKDEADLWVDPIGIIKIKDWWIEPFMTAVNRRTMSHQRFEQEKKRKISQAEYLRECPKERPLGPFHPMEGYCCEVSINGKGKDQTWSIRVDPIEALSKGDMIAIIAAYPDLMSEILPIGHDQVEDYADWAGKNKGKTKSDYDHYRKLILQEAQAEMLGLNEEDSSSPLDDDDVVEINDETTGEDGEGDVDAYSLEGTDNLDDLNIEDDLPI